MDSVLSRTEILNSASILSPNIWDEFTGAKLDIHYKGDFDESLRWAYQFDDFVDPQRNRNNLLDHLLLTQ